MKKHASLAVLFFVLSGVMAVFALDRQPNADYRARREALAKKTDGGIVLLFAPMESEGPNALYGFRQDRLHFCRSRDLSRQLWRK